jgi:prepilin-type N-terminal cleavage/methylation domain-containing protein
MIDWQKMRKRVGCRGFSLVEMLVVVGVMSIVILGFAQLLEYQLRATKGTEVSNEFQDLKRQFSQYIASPGICTETFRGFAPGAQIDRILYDSGTVFYNVAEGKPFPGSQWVITSMRLMRPDELPAGNALGFPVMPTDSNGVSTGVLEVRAELSASAKAKGAATSDQKTFYARFNGYFGKNDLLLGYQETDENKASALAVCSLTQVPPVTFSGAVNTSLTFDQLIRNHEGSALPPGAPIVMTAAARTEQDLIPMNCSIFGMSGASCIVQTCAYYNPYLSLAECIQP